MTGPSGVASSNPLVIVVDDDAAVRNSLKFALEIEGFVVITYESAEQLVDAGDLSACQCLIVDHDMPCMTGLELVAALRKQGAEIPAILISGHVTRSLTKGASDAGIPLIEKPFEGNGLIELIRTAIDRKPH